MIILLWSIIIWCIIVVLVLILLNRGSHDLGAERTNEFHLKTLDRNTNINDTERIRLRFSQ